VGHPGRVQPPHVFPVSVADHIIPDNITEHLSNDIADSATYTVADL